MNNPSPIRKLLPTLLAAAAGLLLTGCVGVVPMPVTSHVEYGHRLDPTNTVRIRPGLTTRAEVIAALGTNYARFGRSRALAYTWELRGGGGVWWVALALGEVAVVQGGNWAGGWRGFLIAFDEQDVVRAAEFKRLSPRYCLDEIMDRWVAKLPPTPPAEQAAILVVADQPWLTPSP